MPTSMNGTASHWTARFRAWRDPVVSLFLIVAASVVIIKNWPWSTTMSSDAQLCWQVGCADRQPVERRSQCWYRHCCLCGFPMPLLQQVRQGDHAATGGDFRCAWNSTAGLQALSPSFYKSALVAAQGAACAQQFGKFWDVHDRLFDAGASLDRDRITGIGALLGLSPNWQQCVDSTESRLVSRDRSEGASLGVRSTPTILMGSVLTTRTLRVDAAIEGARPFTDFEKQLNKLKAGAH